CPVRIWPSPEPSRVAHGQGAARARRSCRGELHRQLILELEKSSVSRNLELMRGNGWIRVEASGRRATLRGFQVRRSIAPRCRVGSKHRRGRWTFSETREKRASRT